MGAHAQAPTPKRQIAAKALAKEVSGEDLERGRIYPPLNRIREASAAVAEAVAGVAYAHGLATEPRPESLSAHIRSMMYEPKYESYVDLDPGPDPPPRRV
jgi:malate dehydrogenase (oxaloacetate-decarboxylating)(NADP+)